MPQLKHSKVYRGGITANVLHFETSNCSASVDQSDGALEVRFHLASKGGGTTSVLLQIGKDDFEALLQEIANKLPDSVGILSDCAAIANKRNLELLESARKVEADEKARAKILIDDLEVVQQYVNEKWFAAPAGEDAREESARTHIQKVLSTLRGLH